MEKSKIQKLVLTGVFAALLAVLSQVSIPMPSGVPVTLQTFAVALCAYVLGWKLGTLAVAVYLALGAVGLPVFAGFSGGFLWGFLLMALLCGLGAQTGKPVFALLLGALGIAVCHFCGVLQYAAVASAPFLESFLLVSAPYLLKDGISLALAYLAARAVVYSLKKARLVGE